MATAEEPPLDIKRHIRYWQRCYRSPLPHHYTSHDSTRMALAFFIISALDLLSKPDQPAEDTTAAPLPQAQPLVTPEDRQSLRSWVRNLQHPEGGFCGSPIHLPPPYTVDNKRPAENGATKPIFDLRSAAGANIAATYFALLLLPLAAENLESAAGAYACVDRVKTLKWLKRLQRPDGSFGELITGDGHIMGGKDMRYCYLAASIRWCLRGNVKPGDEAWVEDIDVDSLVKHIRAGQAYDGGIAESSQHEPHAGYTYCAVSALNLLDRPLDASVPNSSTLLNQAIPNMPHLIRFLAFRQFTYLPREDDEDDEQNFFQPPSLASLSLSDGHLVGFNGRCNKVADTCYCWWVAGTLKMLGHSGLVQRGPSRRFMLTQTEHLIGGFSKYPGGPPDLYHAYLGLAALATMEEPSLKEFDAPLCVSTETVLKICKAREVLVRQDSVDPAVERDVFWADKQAA